MTGSNGIVKKTAPFQDRNLDAQIDNLVETLSLFPFLGVLTSDPTTTGWGTKDICWWINCGTPTEISVKYWDGSTIQKVSGNIIGYESVLKTDFNADTFLYASADNTPLPTSPADVLAALSGHAGAAFNWNSQNLVGIGNITVGSNKWIGLGAAAERLEFYTAGYAAFMGCKVGIGTTSPNQKLTIEGTMSLKEQAAANADTAAYGQLWVKNTTPCELWFTDDAGNDSQLTGGMSKSLWLPFNALKAPGTKPAEFKDWGISGVWEFSDGTDDTIVFNIQTPYDMDINVAPSLLIGWSTNTAVTTETAVWQLEYLWTSEGEDTTAAAQETLTVNSNAIAQANGLIVAEITGIDLPGATDACMHCRVKRLGADPADDLTDTAELHGICFKYTSS